IAGEMETLQRNKISLHSIGDIAQLPQECRTELQDAIEETAGNTGLKLILALSYSSRWDILNAVENIVKSHSREEITEKLSESFFKQHLTTGRFPDPELLIRTSGEHRVSNFLLWEIAYTELYFCSKLWPEFKKDDLYLALLDYQKRERRFGLTSEQIKY
ncbi:MAG: polyprenyl diphosphate synthase, partial [Bacteroidota bacterium]|nr:polyprenyl diphosphate synthase [Bacteroidota bacterium]